MPRRFLLTLLLICFALHARLSAEVTRVEFTTRADIAGTDYEEISGRLHFEIDPRLPSNAVIADVELAPVNERGKVAFSSDLRILKPKDAAEAAETAWMEVPNRGGKSTLTGWVMRHRLTVVNVGWEFDLPTDSGRMRIDVPVARNTDGSPIRGVVSAVFTLDQREDERLITDLANYPPVDIEGPDSRLIIRDRAAFPGGTEVPRPRWSLDGNRLKLAGGFEPGQTYEIFYLTEGPPVAGLGYAAIRDAAAWLRHHAASPVRPRYLYAMGSSQCGRLLRDFLYLGFNSDEKDRPVFDGVLAHVAGAGRLVLNQRWSTPRAVAGYATASYPFADTAQPDPVSGASEGILENPRARHLPKVFYTNMAAEYWGAGRVAALIHTNPEGTRDIDPHENVRVYLFSGTSHGAAPFPPTALVEGAPLANPVSAGPSILALRLALHQWVAEGVEPPPSARPRLDDGTLVPVSAVDFPNVPGLSSPHTIAAGVRVQNPLLPGGGGRGAVLPLLVPRPDADGTDLGGIRMPEVAVPLGTATGWVFRPAALGAPHEPYLLRGAWVPFARTKAEREAANDPRPSLEERYESKEAFLERVRTATMDLISRRLLAEEDLDRQARLASERWDWVTSRGNN